MQDNFPLATLELNGCDQLHLKIFRKRSIRIDEIPTVPTLDRIDSFSADYPGPGLW
jgi:hypothetical protein